LQAEGGWRTVVGLFRLEPGANQFGRDAGDAIVLPDGPAHAGAFELPQGKVSLAVDVTRRETALDSPDAVKAGRLSLLATSAATDTL
jgi:hypothetical protein